MMFAEQLLGARRSVLNVVSVTRGLHKHHFTDPLSCTRGGWMATVGAGGLQREPAALAGGCSSWSEFYNFTEYL